MRHCHMFNLPFRLFRPASRVHLNSIPVRPYFVRRLLFPQQFPSQFEIIRLQCGSLSLRQGRSPLVRGREPRGSAEEGRSSKSAKSLIVFNTINYSVVILVQTAKRRGRAEDIPILKGVPLWGGLPPPLDRGGGHVALALALALVLHRAHH